MGRNRWMPHTPGMVASACLDAVCGMSSRGAAMLGDFTFTHFCTDFGDLALSALIAYTCLLGVFGCMMLRIMMVMLVLQLVLSNDADDRSLHSPLRMVAQVACHAGGTHPGGMLCLEYLKIWLPLDVITLVAQSTTQGAMP